MLGHEKHEVTGRLYLEQLLILGDLVFNLATGSAGDGPPRHLVEGLRTARNQPYMRIWSTMDRCKQIQTLVYLKDNTTRMNA